MLGRWSDKNTQFIRIIDFVLGHLPIKSYKLDSKINNKNNTNTNKLEILMQKV